jgi:DNA-directed RNA polymerase subunit RPC12/RpoP
MVNPKRFKNTTYEDYLGNKMPGYQCPQCKMKFTGSHSGFASGTKRKTKVACPFCGYGLYKPGRDIRSVD